MERLRPHQRGPSLALEDIVRQFRSGVDLSKTGTGKTYTAASVASSLGEPTLVVGPKIAQATWEKAAAHFGDSFSYLGYEKLRTGRTPFGHWDNPDPKTTISYRCQCCQCEVDIENPQPCYCHPVGIHCLETVKRRAKYGKFTFHPAVKMVIFDEVHRCNGRDSLNADMLIAAKRQGIRTLGLSATAACSPLNMRALGYLLDLHSLDADRLGTNPKPSFYRWAAKHGCVRDPRFRGWKWLVGQERQKEIMLQIRAQIIPDRGVSVDWSDIPGFPTCQISAELYTLDNPEDIDGCYHEMAAAVEAHNLKSANDRDPEHPLTKILRARQKVELLKVPIFTELAEDYLAQGLSVVIFVNFRQTIDELFKRFPEWRVIDGSRESVKNRNEYVELFQENQIPGLIVNSDAGGVALSLHDLVGNHPRCGLVSPSFSAAAMRQVFGRLHRDGGLSPCFYRVVFADKTVEVPIHRAVAPKLNNLDSLNDGDLTPENLMLR